MEDVRLSVVLLCFSFFRQMLMYKLLPKLFMSGHDTCILEHLTHQPDQSILPTGVPSSARSKLGSRRLGLPPCLPVSLPGWRCVHISGASKMISCFHVASKPLSQPWLTVCWGTAGSPNAISTQCVWASPLATLALTGVGWRGYPQSLFLCVPLCCTSFSSTCTLSPSSSQFICRLSATSLFHSK